MLEKKFIVNKNVAILKIKNRKGVEYSCKIDAADISKIADKQIYLNSNNYFLINDKVNKKNIYLSRYLLLEEVEKREKELDKKLVVDHINGDIYDNRKENLRVATYGENRVNCNKGKIFGICKNNNNKFVVHVGAKNVGTYKTLEEAEKIRAIGEIVVYKDFSRLDKEMLEKYNINLEGIDMSNKTEYVTKLKYDRIVTYIENNKKICEIKGFFTANIPVEYENENYFLVKNVLRKVVFKEENGEKKVVVTQVKVLKNAIDEVLKNDN